MAFKKILPDFEIFGVFVFFAPFWCIFTRKEQQVNEGLAQYWATVQFQQAGGIEPYAAMLAANNTQGELKVLGCTAPDSHGALMDAPAWIAPGTWR